MTSVLLAEDDPAISEPLARALRREGYEVGVSADGPATIEAARGGGIDLILLDIGLPKLDGLEVCRRLRSEGHAVPVLILTARADEVDTVIGLDAGADDYVTKPFRLAELLARVRALLRRGATESRVVQGVRVDNDARRAWLGDTEIDLTSKEFDLLSLLVSEAGKVVSREQIMRQVWDSKWWGSTKTLDMHVSWLRRKLGDDAHSPRFITTVRGVGFRFERRDAILLATGLQDRVDAGLPPNATELGKSLSDRYVIISERGVGRTTIGTSPGSHDSITGRDSTKDFTVTVVADDSLVATAVTDGLVVIGSLVLLALAVAVGLAILQARRLARPLQDLANAADRLGSGDARPLGRRYGVPELDRVAERLDGSAQRINDLLTAERDFAADASHQLRTPLTALSMRLEEMMAAAEYPDVVREEGAAALAQTERLADVVGQLLGRARRTAAGA